MGVPAGQTTIIKLHNKFIDIFVDCISKGGNLLLDIGPKADGSIDPIQKERLLELGSWIRKHHKAVYETEKGIPLRAFLWSHYFKQGQANTVPVL